MKKILSKVLAFGTSFALIMSTGFANSSLYGVLAKASVTTTNDILESDKNVENSELLDQAEDIEVTESPEEADQKEYLIVTSGKKGYQRVEDFAVEEEIIEENLEEGQEVLEEKNMLVLSLDEEEKAEIEGINGVESLERDWGMSANEEVPFDEELVEEIVESEGELEFNQWNLDAINLPYNDAPAGITISTGPGITENNIDIGKKYTGKGVKVAVLDSGVSYTENINVVQRINFEVEQESSNVIFDDPSGHGTGIAGIIVASEKKGNLRGIATNAELYSVQILDINNETTVSQVIQGIYWCIENEMDVINMSFGTSHYSSALESAIQDARAAGIIMVAAAGNKGEQAEGIEYPAAFPEVIAVGASDGNNAMTDFTSKGDGIDILAPGEKVWTQSVFQGTMAIDGTSIATAHVTGAVALLLEKYPEADGEFLRQLLQTSSSLAMDQKKLGVLNVAAALERGKDFKVSEEAECVPQERVQTEYDTDEIVTGCWGRGNHESMLLEECGKGRNIQIASKVANIVDVAYPAKKGYGAIHGRHNYIANLHYLYIVVKQFLKTDKKREKCCEYAAENSPHTQDETYGSDDYNHMKKIITSLWDSDNKIAYQDDGTTPTTLNSREEKAWAVAGIAVHLLGDMFAHRTIVPSTEKYEKKYFTDDKLEELRTATGNNVIEFRDIKNYKKSSIEKSDINSVYEDNPSFYENRYYAATKAVGIMIGDLKALRGYDVIGILKNCGLDTSEKSAIKLNNLLNYANSAGYTGSDLAIYSSTGYRVNYIDNIYTTPDADLVDYVRHSVC